MAFNKTPSSELHTSEPGVPAPLMPNLEAVEVEGFELLIVDRPPTRPCSTDLNVEEAPTMRDLEVVEGKGSELLTFECPLVQPCSTESKVGEAPGHQGKRKQIYEKLNAEYVT